MGRLKREPDTIAQLKADRRVYGQCPRCSGDFPLEAAVLFYADDPVPEPARQWREAKGAELQTRSAELRERRCRASKGAMQKAIDVNIGKILERVAPVCEGFESIPRDCRPLFDPIDYIVFDGLFLYGDVKSITFIDVKTGNSGLNQRQRQIRDAIESGKVEWQEYTIGARP